MRTREANRNKNYSTQRYGFEGSSDDDEVAQPQSRRRRNADDEDANFDGEAQGPEHGSRAESDDADSALDSAASASDDAVQGRGSRAAARRSRSDKPFQARAAAKSAAYIDIEPFPNDSHMPRGYVGGYDRHIRGTALLRAWYGPRKSDVEKAVELVDEWIDWPLLPPAEAAPVPGTVRKGLWDEHVYEVEARHAQTWQDRLRAQDAHGTVVAPLSEQESRRYRPPPKSLAVLMGPHASQQETLLRAGEAQTLSQLGTPLNEDGEEDLGGPAGWVLDAGGIVPSLDWATQTGPDAPQLLALAVTPHRDEQNDERVSEDAAEPVFQSEGTVQVWEMHGTRTRGRYIRPAVRPPKLVKVLCFDSGRAKRVRWSPACRHLAILSASGAVDIVDPLGGGDAVCDKLQRPIASLVLGDGIKATAMTWMTFNRLSVGYADGTVALWSIHPNCLLSRHPVHHSSVVDMASGYPTLPYVVASTPIGGFARLVDLRSPSYETTEVPSLAINTAPNLLSWSDHMRGYFSMTQTSNVLNTMVGFMHQAFFPIPRRTCAADSFVTCLAVGRTHPYLLVGAADGSLSALNPQFELVSPTRARREPTEKMPIFQHEHCPPERLGPGPPPAGRGVSRILHGFGPEKTRISKSDTKGGTKTPKNKTEKSKKSKPSGGGGGDNDGDGGSDDAGGGSDPTRVIVYEPLTRITAVEWNPNQGYGCWAAAAMGSGLVKVMDLGLDWTDDDGDDGKN